MSFWVTPKVSEGWKSDIGKQFYSLERDNIKFLNKFGKTNHIKNFQSQVKDFKILKFLQLCSENSDIGEIYNLRGGEIISLN